MYQVTKRDGTAAQFEIGKISAAITKAIIFYSSSPQRHRQPPRVVREQTTRKTTVGGMIAAIIAGGRSFSATLIATISAP